jgi:hypothetical protein
MHGALQRCTGARAAMLKASAPDVRSRKHGRRSIACRGAKAGAFSDARDPRRIDFFSKTQF